MCKRSVQVAWQAAHDKAGEKVKELEGADAAGGGQGPVRARTDHEQRADADEAEDLDAQPSHHGVVHQRSREVIPAPAHHTVSGSKA